MVLEYKIVVYGANNGYAPDAVVVGMYYAQHMHQPLTLYIPYFCMLLFRQMLSRVKIYL